MHIRHNIVFTRNGISRIETGQRYVTDLELIAFADVLQVSTAWLLGETHRSYPKEKVLTPQNRPRPFQRTRPAAYILLPLAPFAPAERNPGEQVDIVTEGQRRALTLPLEREGEHPVEQLGKRHTGGFHR